MCTCPGTSIKKVNNKSSFPYIFQLERDLSREPQQPVAVGSSPFIPSDPVPSLTGVKDEYNPLRPNDYEEITKKKKEQRQKEDDERKRDRGDDFDRNRFVI